MIPQIQDVLYYGKAKAKSYPESLLVLYERVMNTLKVDTMTSKEQAIIILELSETIKNQFLIQYSEKTISESKMISAYFNVCNSVLTNILNKIST